MAVYCGDARQRIVGQKRDVIDLALADTTWERVTREGFTHAMRLPVKGAPRFVKVIVYDDGANRIGSAVVDLQPPKPRK